MIIAIDGPAGCGKSTTARKIADKLGFYYLNTGSFYRAYTLSQLNRGLDPLDQESVYKTALETHITVRNGNICLDGENVESLLHTPLVDKYCSEVSHDPRIREMVNKSVREIASNLDVITEGRDTTTVIFPNADLKFYFDATPEVRAERRMKDFENANYSEVLTSIKKRDKLDKEKPVGALKVAPNAIYLDTTNLTIDEVCEKVYSAMQKH